jgi:lysozyme
VQIGQKGLDLIKEFEGFRDKAYKDEAGVWTIGYGTIRVNNVPVTQGMTCTQADAERWLRDYVRPMCTRISTIVKVPLTQNQFDALASFAYNLGDGALQQSTLLRTLHAKQPITEAMFTAWNKVRANGVLRESDGLTRRRKREYQLFIL